MVRQGRQEKVQFLGHHRSLWQGGLNTVQHSLPCTEPIRCEVHIEEITSSSVFWGSCSSAMISNNCTGSEHSGFGSNSCISSWDG